ncbi:uncharacterized protein LOC142656914 isoform X5 [Rhinoderma darwinii]|uniref:uncharacterized protein LOC142656914 isoform X5 n=1 Tax=Rhinoderma darwinii TaxID=43563 RepID=UPI003F673E19
MDRAPAYAIILLLSIWGSYHRSGALSPPINDYSARPAPNIALNGIATQSSTNSYFGSAQNANDGSMAANSLRSQCSYTKKESGPWWRVNLKARYSIMSVAITNRVLECCRERIFGAEIIIGDDPSTGGTRCGVISSIESGETLSFSCQGMVGQYVTVTIPEREEHLVLCEVQVYGFLADGSDDANPSDPKTPNGAPNVALKGIAQQSSLYNMYGEPKNAVDGSLDSNYLYIQCAGTSEQEDPWWMVDLKSEFKVFTVAVTNRGDCCAEKIRGAEIRIGNSGENGGTKNPKCGVITSMEHGQTLAFECDGMLGQYVTVFIPGAKHSLTICEVQVYGLPSGDEVSDTGDVDIDFPLFQLRRLPGRFTAISGYFDYNTEEAEVLEFEDTPVKPDSFDSEEHELASELRNILKHSNAAPNVAMTSTTRQSSTDGGNSSAAIDGDLKKCSKTAVEKSPWWTLDLGSDHKVYSIAVTSWINSSAQELDEAEIHVGSSATGWKKNPICGTLSSIGPGETFSFNCDGLEGRYVTIVLPDKVTSLSLCEVQVFALSVDTPSGDWNGDFEVQKNHHGVKNLAPGGIPAQSSYYGSRSSVTIPIDGSLSSNYMAGECTHTRMELGPWWNLDLKSTYRISSVAITNRGDCCRERINGAEILIGDSAEDGGIGNPRCGVVFRMNYGETLSFNCKGMEGRYVTIVIPDQRQYLSLCEVQVFGELSEISQGGKEELTVNLPEVTNLEGKYFLFPEESVTDYIVLTPALPMRLRSFTLCMNLSLNVSENRETILFSYRTLYHDELNLWLEANGDIGFYMSGEGLMFPRRDKSKEWNHLCLTWESKNGRCELWLNGRRSGNKVYRRRHAVRPGGVVILGQDQDALSNFFDKSQSYIGKIKDLNMWNKVLSLKSLQSLFKGKEVRKGEIFDWSNLSYAKKGNVEVV